ncbi:MAG: polyprenyl synthetase family protein [Rikenellaceae bacterium]
MITLSQIKRPIESTLAEFDTFAQEQFRTENELLREMMVDALSSRGKGVRPILVFLCAAISSPTHFIGKRAFISALMIEMIHLSSLIHDDVIDEAATRRDKPTLNSKWQSKRAVLVGDYILARNLIIGLSSGQFDLVSHITRAIATLCEGEVIQDDRARRGVMTMFDYFDIVNKKTASLISISCSSGGLSAGAKGDEVTRLGELGKNIGIAFQIQDDILDYDSSANSGKESFKDLAEGKITLPLLMLLERDSEERRGEIIELLRQAPTNSEALSSVARYVVEGGGVALASDVMNRYINNALAILSEYPDSEYRSALIDMCAFIIQRDR